MKRVQVQDREILMKEQGRGYWKSQRKNEREGGRGWIVFTRNRGRKRNKDAAGVNQRIGGRKLINIGVDSVIQT